MPTRVVRRTRPASYAILLAALLGLLLSGCTTDGPAHVAAGRGRCDRFGTGPGAGPDSHHHRSHHHQTHKPDHQPRHQTPAREPADEAADPPRHQRARRRPAGPQPDSRGSADHEHRPGVHLRLRLLGARRCRARSPTRSTRATTWCTCPYAHEVDHLVSLELGGSNAIGNLWPEPYAGRWGARTKDVLENRLHELVCSGQLGACAGPSAWRRPTGWPPTGDSSAARRPPATRRPRAPRRQTRPRRAGGGSCEPGYSPCLPVTSDLDCGDIPDSRSRSTSPATTPTVSTATATASPASCSRLTPSPRHRATAPPRHPSAELSGG